MVKFPSLRACLMIFLGLGFLVLAGCEKPGTTTESQPGAPAAPTPTPAPKSATPNSFDAVAAQLDPGGDLYFYLSTAQWLGKLSQGLDKLHDALLSGSNDMAPENRAQAEKTFALVKDIVQKSGLEDLTGIGASSFALKPDLHRNKLFIHHDEDKGNGLIWSLVGKTPHALTGLDLLPLNTALAGFGDFDVAQLINFLRQEGDQSGIPEVKDAINQWQTQFSGLTGQKLDDVLNSLNGSEGIVLTLDGSNTITVPVGERAEKLPAPRIALLIAVKNDLIFKTVDKLLTGNPAILKVDEPDLRMRTAPLPFLPELNLRPTLAQWNGYLVVASNEQVIRDMQAVQKGTPGFKSTAEYATLSANLPAEGNSFCVCSQYLVDTIRKLQDQTLANQAGNTAQAQSFERLFSGSYQNVGHFYSVGTSLPDGWLTVSQGTQGSSQMLGPILIPPAIAAATFLYMPPALSHLLNSGGIQFP